MESATKLKKPVDVGRQSRTHPPTKRTLGDNNHKGSSWSLTKCTFHRFWVLTSDHWRNWGSEKLGKAPEYIVLARDECRFKLCLLVSKNYAIQTQIESEKVKQWGKAVVMSLPASCTEILPTGLFPSLSPLPQGPEELCGGSRREREWRGRQKQVITIWKQNNCLAGKMVSYSKH